MGSLLYFTTLDGSSSSVKMKTNELVLRDKQFFISAEQGLRYTHNAVHIWLGGTVAEVDSAVNDPIFFVHHSFIDSLLERWLSTNRDRENDGKLQPY